MKRTAYAKIRRQLSLWVLPTMLLVAMAFTLYDIDRQRYMRAKRTIINENFYQIFPVPETLDAKTLEMLYGESEEQRAKAREELSRTLKGIVYGPLAIFKAQLLDESGNSVLEFENTRKHREVNSWRNNLLLRTFWGSTELRLKSPNKDGNGRPKTVRMQLFYTTPVNYKPIEELTTEYRWYIILVMLIFLGLYVLLDRTMVRPLRRVAEKLQETEEGTIRLIAFPRTNLETGYNLMAGSALAQEVRNRLGLVSQPDISARETSLHDALEYILETLPVREIVTVQMMDDRVVLAKSCPEFRNSEEADITLQRLILCRHSEDEPQFSLSENKGSFSFSEKTENMLILVSGALSPGAYHRHGGESLAQTLWRVCRSLAQGLAAQQQAGATIHRQRSEANITLSHNLGHDLTNIIATSKLDLMAINKLTQNPGVPLPPAKQKMLAEAVAGLSQTTRFLQEIVNIYRSFSHVRKPAYERHNVNTLIADFLDAFTPTISGRIRFERELNAMPDSMIVEPRLLKLALFNLLTNASQALRRQVDEAGLTPPNQTVTVRTRLMPENGMFAIEVQDNGTGIRNPAGALLPPAEIPRIFEYGYTTREQGGEGMGLDWVRTIAVKFHNGIAEAENPPEGGALLRIGITSMEVVEAQVPDA